MEPQQSPLYAQYMKHLKWGVASIDGTNIFWRRFPLLGAMAKIHRPEKLPPLKKLIPFLRNNHIRRLVVEPIATDSQSHVTRWCRSLPSWVSLNRSPFLPTKTIRIDLTQSEEEIFHAFTEAKRRAVRRATKLGVTVEQSKDIDALIRVKNTSAGLFGGITTTGIRELWKIFAPKHAAILLAYAHSADYRLPITDYSPPIGGILLLFWDGIAYYWIAAGTKKGKKLFTPTLLVYEALKLAKLRKAKQLDFVGVWDERVPRQNHEWKGFTKFKEGFGGQTLYYPLINR